MRELFMQNAWFYLELVYKSLTTFLNTSTHCLSNTHKNQFRSYIKSSRQPSLNTFCMKLLSTKFISDVELLINLMTKELIHKTAHSSSLNCSLAFFLLDLMSILDRGFLFRRIDLYFKETNSSLVKISNAMFQLSNKSARHSTCLFVNFKQLHSMQLDFLRILSSHEHFIALNFPIFFDKSAMKPEQQNAKFIVESNEYFGKHFLLGLVLRQMYKSLHSAVTSIQFKSTQLLRSIIEAFDIDPRLTHNKQMRAHIAYMCMPFMSLFIHFIPLMARKPNKNAAEKELNDADEDCIEMGDEASCFDLSSSFFKENSGEALSDLTEATLNLDEFDVDLDRNDQFISMDDILNEELIESTERLEARCKPRNDHQEQKKFGKSSAAKQQTQPQQKSLQKKQFKFAKVPCCDFYSLRLNLMLHQANNLDIDAVFTTETSQDLLACFIWILKNMDKSLLFQIWKRWSYIKLKKVLVLLDLAVNYFGKYTFFFYSFR